MKRLIALVIVAVALGWGAVALDFGADPSDAPDAAANADGSAEPNTAEGESDDAREPEPRAPTPPRQPTEPAAAEPAEPGEPEAPPQVEDRSHDPEFLEMGRLYATEPRDGEWALAHEQRLAAMVERAESRRTVHVHCRTTVCRLTVEGGAPQDLIEVLNRPGVRSLTYLSESSPYSLEGGSFTVYYRRTGDQEPGALP